MEWIAGGGIKGWREKHYERRQRQQLKEGGKYVRRIWRKDRKQRKQMVQKRKEGKGKKGNEFNKIENENHTSEEGKKEMINL